MIILPIKHSFPTAQQARELRGDSHIHENIPIQDYDFEKYRANVEAYIHNQCVSEIWYLINKPKTSSKVLLFPQSNCFGRYTDEIFMDSKTDEILSLVRTKFVEKGFTLSLTRSEDRTAIVMNLKF